MVKKRKNHGQYKESLLTMPKEPYYTNFMRDLVKNEDAYRTLFEQGNDTIFLLRNEHFVGVRFC